MPLSALLKNEIRQRAESEIEDLEGDCMILKSESCKDNFLAS
jgi:hypothetical protein